MIFIIMETVQERRKAYLKAYKAKLKEEGNLQRKEYRKANKTAIREYGTAWRKANKVRINQNIRDRKKSDPLFKASCNIRRLINHAIKTYGITKQGKTVDILGCTFLELKQHLENQFELWMCWDNYGLYNGELNHGWDIDHITPLSSATSEEELIKLNHHTNLQPLCSKRNRDIKKDNIG